MQIKFRKAERKKAKLRCALCGVSGSGKTWSALNLATGIGGKIVVVDTENGSADLYANDFDFSVYTMKAPFSPIHYMQAIKEAENAGFDIIIIDSLSHAWMGEGGALEMHANAINMQRGGKNAYTAWREVTPAHNRLVNAILQSDSHIIATMRSKSEVVIQDVDGKKQAVKLGLSAIQRDGMEFEFTFVADISNEPGQKHFAFISKNRTSLFSDNVPFVITKKTGEQLMEWLNTGADNVQQQAINHEQEFNNNDMEILVNDLDKEYRQAIDSSKTLDDLRHAINIAWENSKEYSKHPFIINWREEMRKIFNNRKLKLIKENDNA